MSKVEYDFELSHGMQGFVEIEYEYSPPEYLGGYRTFAGELSLQSVRVRYVIGYDGRGVEVYELRRKDISADRLRLLDTTAYNIVQDRINTWDQLADYMVENR